MTSTNRIKAPLKKEISTIDFVLPEKWTLSNGTPVWGLQAGSQDLVKIDLLFNAGSWYQNENLVAGLTNAFLNQGSKKYTASEIAGIFDFRGAYLQLNADQQYGYVSILTLNKHIEEILEATADLVLNPTFPDKEIKTQIAKRKQQFIIENSKVKTLAHKKFSQVLFGEKHPYANTNTTEDFDLLTPEKLKQFHAQNYSMSNCKIVVAGNYTDELKILLDKYLGNNTDTTNKNEPDYKASPSEIQKHFIPKENAVQSAIRIGKEVVNCDHPDFHGLTILTTILGGYFGSRLMTNIREDKGYTYGIGASIVTFPHAAYLSITTETGADVCTKAVTEIYNEIEKLREQPVGEVELEIVKSYLLGETLRNFDGIFAMSNSLKTLLEAGLDYSHYEKFVEEIRTITPEQLQILALKYYKTEELYEVIAGKV